MPTISINGGRINYIHTGEGPDVVLVHGLATSLAFWYSGIVLPLRHHYQITTYDLRGHGKSSMPGSGYTYGHMAEDLLCLSEHLNLRRFHLVGHSFGGLIALCFAIRYPERLKSLVLADAPIDKGQEGLLASNRPDWWPVLLNKLQDLDVTIHKDDPQPEYRILEAVADPHIRSAIQEIVPISTLMPFGTANGSNRTAKQWVELLNTTTAREDIRFREFSREELQSVRLPTLAIYGMESKWKSSIEILKKHMPFCETVYVNGAGHFHPWERPGVFLEHLCRFFPRH
jgi:pimeloyl-ACP methyl ester carboxylesterase